MQDDQETVREEGMIFKNHREFYLFLLDSAMAACMHALSLHDNAESTYEDGFEIGYYICKYEMIQLQATVYAQNNNVLARH